jgi:hypothetical protein
MTQDMKTPMPPAASGPTASGKRFLAQLIEHALREGWRTPDDFFRHFPAHVLMSALKSAPDLRVAILAAATGIYEEILRRKTPALAAEDLRLALDEGTTSSMQLLAVFSPEDRVRYLDPHRIWDFLAEDHFWQLDPDATDELRRSAAERMTFTLTQALQERLITLRDILDGVTYEAVADSLSPHELRSIVRYALVKGRDGIGLNEKVLLEVLPLDKLVRSVPLEHIWNEVVIRRLAAPAGLTDLSREERRASQRAPAESTRGPSRPPALPSEMVRSLAGEHLRSPEALTAPPRSAPRTPGQLDGYRQLDSRPNNGPNAYDANAYDPSAYGPNDYGIAEYGAEQDELTEISPASARARDNSLLPPPLRSAPSSAAQPAATTDDFNQPLPPRLNPAHGGTLVSRQSMPASFDSGEGEAADRQRQRVTEHLRAIGRLPPRHANMPAGLLRSIDAMYALLPSATDDIQRKSVIRQAFANENYLRAALLGLIELMDSSVDTSDPVIQEAKIEALIKILLFEEQRRKETGRFPAGPFSARMPPSSAPGSFPPGSFPPGQYPPGQYPPGSFPPGQYPPGQYPPGMPLESTRQSGLPVAGYPATSEGFYFPQDASPPTYPSNRSGMSHVATQRPPPPVLSGSFQGAPGPLPNLPAESPATSRRRTVPPPLPPSYPRG